jgi:hypothetical protein
MNDIEESIRMQFNRGEVGSAFIGTAEPSEKTNFSDMLKSVMEKVRLVPKPDNPEVVLMLRTHFEQLKEQCQKGYPVLQGSIQDRMCGLPVEVFETEFEMDMRALELSESGKRCLVCK